jgi:23S rRNA (uridine2552-2'-O)-methyltransferase
MPRSKSSQRWLKEHFNDPYVQKAQRDGYRSRATYKLIEIQERDHLFKKGMTVIDLGAAPGGWSQVITQWVGPQGLVIALDKLPIVPLDQVVILQGDFTETETLRDLEVAIEDRLVDVVVSDMAPNTSGTKSVDQPRMIYLAELALDFAQQHLKPGGVVLQKMFQGPGFEDYLKTFRHTFKQVLIRKPKASRGRSAEVYLIGRHLSRNNQCELVEG